MVCLSRSSLGQMTEPTNDLWVACLNEAFFSERRERCPPKSIALFDREIFNKRRCILAITEERAAEGNYHGNNADTETKFPTIRSRNEKLTMMKSLNDEYVILKCVQTCDYIDVTLRPDR